MKRLFVVFTLALALISTGSVASAHDAEAEIGDAGDTPKTAQLTHGAHVLTTISGFISSRASDADLYAICLNGTEPFSATTEGPGTSLGDTALFLFDAGGYGVYGNDDISDSNFLSRLPAEHEYAPTEPGLYYIGIAMYPLEPASVGGTIFEPTEDPYTAITEPIGPGAQYPLNSWIDPWDVESDSGFYEITLTGTSGGQSCADKRHWLSTSGVLGQGIDQAAGLQKPFNEKSAAAANAGKPISFEICHVRGESGGSLMRVTERALQGHLDHGDTLEPERADLGTVLETEPNDTIADAQALGGASDACGRTAGIGSATIEGTGDDTFDYYSFDAVAGQEITFEIPAANFDTELVLYDTAGNVLEFNDDAGGICFLCSRVVYTFGADGTYVIGLGKFDTVALVGGMVGRRPDLGDSYTLTITTTN